MDVKYLKEKDYSSWDDFVDLSLQGHFWNYSWWINIVTDNDFRICALFDDHQRIVAGIVLPFYSTKRISMPDFTQMLGILFEDFTLQNNIRLQKQLTHQKEYTRLLFDFIERDFRSFDINFSYNYTYWLPLFWRGYQQTTRYTYVIDMKDYRPEDEFSRFSKGHKWIINRARRNPDLSICETDDIEEYINESAKTFERRGVRRPYDVEMLRSLHAEIQKRGVGKLFKIQDSHGNIHGIEYYLYTNREAYYWLGASDTSLRDSGGHTFLTWHAIKYFSSRVRFFNFCGSMIEDVEKNFRNFSAVPIPYYNVRRLARRDKMSNIIGFYFYRLIQIFCK